MKVELIKTFYVEAAHENPCEGVAEARMHGHSYQVDVVSAGAIVPERGWFVDYAEVAEGFRSIHEQLDHACLNRLEGMKETHIEAVRGWIRARIPPAFPGFQDVHVRILGDCAFKPVWLPPNEALNLPERIGFGIEAAHHLPNVPAGHPCSQLHGHSYRFEVGAENLDILQELLRQVYTRLDHRVLNEIEGLENPTSEHLCSWIWNYLRDKGRKPAAVLVQETCAARCGYRGE